MCRGGGSQLSESETPETLSLPASQFETAREISDDDEQAPDVVGRGTRLPKQGLVGATIDAEESLSVEAAADDARFVAATDVASEFAAREMMCVPVQEPPGAPVTAVLQLCNSPRPWICGEGGGDGWW